MMKSLWMLARNIFESLLSVAAGWMTGVPFIIATDAGLEWQNINWHDLLILSDEIYERLLYRNHPFKAFAALGRRLFGRNFSVPKWADIAGRIVRFVLAALVVFALMSVSIAEAVDFRTLPYMWVADLKILGLMLNPIYIIVVLLVGVVSALIGHDTMRLHAYAGPIEGTSVLGSVSVGYLPQRLVEWTAAQIPPLYLSRIRR